MLPDTYVHMLSLDVPSSLLLPPSNFFQDCEDDQPQPELCGGGGDLVSGGQHVHLRPSSQQVRRSPSNLLHSEHEKGESSSV